MCSSCRGPSGCWSLPPWPCSWRSCRSSPSARTSMAWRGDPHARNAALTSNRPRRGLLRATSELMRYKFPAFPAGTLVAMPYMVGLLATPLLSIATERLNYRVFWGARRPPANARRVAAWLRAPPGAKDGRAMGMAAIGGSVLTAMAYALLALTTLNPFIALVRRTPHVYTAPIRYPHTVGFSSDGGDRRADDAGRRPLCGHVGAVANGGHDDPAPSAGNRPWRVRGEREGENVPNPMDAADPWPVAPAFSAVAAGCKRGRTCCSRWRFRCGASRPTCSATCGSWPRFWHWPRRVSPSWRCCSTPTGWTEKASTARRRASGFAKSVTHAGRALLPPRRPPRLDGIRPRHRPRRQGRAATPQRPLHPGNRRRCAAGPWCGPPPIRRGRSRTGHCRTQRKARSDR